MSSTIESVKQTKLTQSQTRVEKEAANFAATWYIAMPSKDLGKKLKAIELFGLPLVAWRDQNGQPVIMERYCSHLGASLAIGEMVNGCIQCPYHHWRYDSSGQCVSIPEVEHIPPTARQATYVTVERYGYIWVWYGSQTPLFPLPEFPAAEDQRHDYLMPWRFLYRTNTTLLAVAENAFDYIHVVTLHRQKLSGSIQVTLLDNPYSAPQSDLAVQGEAWFGVLEEFSISQPFGLNAKDLVLRVDGWPSGHVVTAFAAGEQRLKALFCTTPVAQTKTNAHLLLMVKKTSKFWQDIATYLLLIWQSKMTTSQDIPVWNTMKPDAGSVYTKHDRAILKFRSFYQKWVDKVI